MAETKPPGRPKGPTLVRLNGQISKRVADALDELSRETGTTKRELMERAIRAQYPERFSD
jgi:hypothetical protein